MLVGRLLFDVTCVLYALTLVLLFLDVLQPRRAVNRTALVLLFVVFVMETVVLLNSFANNGYAPIFSRFDLLLLLSWHVLLIAVVVDTFFRIGVILFFGNVAGFALVAFDLFARQGSAVYTARQGDLLTLHVTSAIISYALFMFACLFSIMYLLQDWLLREKRWNRWFLRLPSLDQLDLFAFRSIAVGFPILLVSMVLGTIWGVLTLHRWVLLDPTPIATMTVWLMYGAYLALRLRSGWGGRRLAAYNLICFIGIIANFIVVSKFSVFHPIA